MSAKTTLTAVALAAALLTLAAPGQAQARSRVVERGYEPVVRDCTPINGPHGYYGNAWCDRGFLTLEEQEYRHAKRLDIDRRGLRYRPGRRNLFRAR